MKNLMAVLFAIVTISAYGQKKQTGRPGVDSLINDPDSVAVQQKLKQLSSGSEKNMLTVLNYYFANKSKKDSVIALIVQRYPKGNVAFNEAQQKLYAEDDSQKREQILIKMKLDFPGRDMDQNNYVVSDAYAKGGNIPKARAYLDMIKDTTKNRMALAYDAQRIYLYNPAAADNLFKPEIERLTKAGVPKELGPKNRYHTYFYLYSDILYKEGKYQEALKYMQIAYPYFNPKSDKLTGDYGLVNYKNGLYAEALPSLQKLVDGGKTDAEIKSAFIVSYEKVNPGKSAAEYLKKTDAALMATMENRIGKTLINEAAPNFEVKDIHGKAVSLADFKGKTIILDFWATWCGPCKASFPTMQRVVNSYAKNPNVKFLFIHTLETNADPLSGAKKYLADNHYNFDLYMDQKDPKTKKNNAVDAFGAKAIPAKFIIDGKGNIRFKLVGFSGDEDDSVKELTAMIEIVKNNI